MSWRRCGRQKHRYWSSPRAQLRQLKATPATLDEQANQIAVPFNQSLRPAGHSAVRIMRAMRPAVSD